MVFLWLSEKKNENRNLKLLSEGQLKIISKEKEVIPNSELIDDVKFKIDNINDLVFQGNLIVSDTQGTSHSIINITDKDNNLNSK